MFSVDGKIVRVFSVDWYKENISNIRKIKGVETGKYQEALDRLSCNQDNPTCECVCGYEKSDCKYANASITLQELVDKEEKYKWHDLRKDPYDLPTQDNRYLVVYDFKDEIVDMEFRGIEVAAFMQGKFTIDGIVAWKNIEEFEDE